MHVSLPTKLEDMVKERVDSGIYGSASEVVRIALRKFFNLSEADNMSFEEKQYIMEIVGSRLEAVNNGKAKLQDFDDVMNEIDKELFE